MSSIKVKRSMVIVLCIVAFIQLYILLQSLSHNNNAINADINEAILSDTGTNTSINDNDTNTEQEQQYSHIPLGLLLGSGYSHPVDPNRDREHHEDIPCSGITLTGGCITPAIGVDEELVTGTVNNINSCIPFMSSERNIPIVENVVPCTGGLTPPLGVDEIPFTDTYTGTIGTGIKIEDSPTTGSLQGPVDDEVSVTPPNDPIVIITPPSGGGGGGGGGVHRDECITDLSPSYYDNTCDGPVEEIIPTSPVKVSITNAPSPTISCYYNDGEFVIVNYRDIDSSPYKSFISQAINDCLIHGIADTQRYYRPDQAITQGEVIKMIIRKGKGKYLPSSFNHFAWKDRYPYRRTPYLRIAQREGMLENVEHERSDQTMYNKAYYSDIINIMGKNISKPKGKVFISRGEFASLLYK